MELNINFSLVFAVLAVGLLAITGDSTLTWTSPMYPKLYSNDTKVNPLGKPITEEQDTWIGSLISIGAMVGPFLFVHLAENYGRKLALLCIAIPHITSFLTLAFAKNIYLYYFARLLGGLSEGAGYSVMPMYIAEISEDSNRGMFLSMLNCFWTFGNFFPYAIGPFMKAMWFNVVLACLPITFFITFLFFAPETPYFYAKKNRFDEAEKSLRSLRNVDDKLLKIELEHIKSSIANEEHGSIKDIIKSRPLQKALTISVVLVCIQQLSGFNAIVSYLLIIFNSSGSAIPDEIACIIFGALLFASSFFAPFITDRWGRKILLITSCLGIFLSHIALGSFFYVKNNTTASIEPIKWLPIVSLLCFNVFFNVGLSPIPWSLSAELFPSSVRSSAATITSSSCWMTSFFVTKCFNMMVDHLGNAGTFWFYAWICFFGGIFTLFFVPETKGKSFVEIQSILAGEKSTEKINENYKENLEKF
ncbi:unnamed protein product [Brassicogethes aeneus]|uniref:Major facilitator superfamily (MFS) profile domain-containing protein n=1 Tax=Brassicogethes aeneus TaxID=1431903 RepID=A0A9P0B7G5_BRAAE|nr:unnamed protein product [Brassicogethes aeneus]